jgi:hypothetical protein
MLPFGVTIPAAVPQGSEIPEGLMNNPVSVYKLKIEVRLSNPCCSRRAITVTYSECVFVALGIQHLKRVHHTVTCGLPRSTIFFSHYLINGTIFGEKVTEHKMCVLIFSIILSKIFLILRKIKRYITTNVHTCIISVGLLLLHVKYPLFLSDFNEI